jgi:hypothetical protein
MNNPLVDLIREAATRGCTDGDISRVTGYSTSYICILRRRNGIASLNGKGRPTTVDSERLVKIAERLKSGETLQEIGDSIGLTRERVRQIAKKSGVTGQMSRAKRRETYADRESARLAKRIKERDERYERMYGCSYETVRSLNEGLKASDPASKAVHYRLWIRNCARLMRASSGITFPQWVEIWGDKWQERGRGRSYKLARIDRRKGFTPDNVVVERGDEMMSRHWKTLPWNTTQASQ